jgi:hypothetical protein
MFDRRAPIYRGDCVEPSLLICPSCGAPLPPHAIKTVVVCKHCGASVTRGIHDVKSSRFRIARAAMDREIPADENDVTVGARRYRILGRVARGESTDVFYAREARRAGSMVLIKVLRSEADRDFLERERNAVDSLVRNGAHGAHYFSLLIPQILTSGSLAWRGAVIGECTVVRAASGFVDTLVDVRAAFPNGVDPRHAVWIYKRMLEVLAWVHESGWVHCAILPQHIVINAREHGLMIVGFSCANRIDGHAFALHESQREFYPDAVPRGDRLPAAVDLVMAARVIAYLLGGNSEFVFPPSVPAPISDLVRASATADVFSFRENARDVLNRVSLAAKEAFGPPRFVELTMPRSTS